MTTSSIGNYDPHCFCTHTPDQRYTRVPCSCGRELWPPRGRGRGESLYSPRRIAAKLKACDALCLHIEGYTHAEIACRLGYKTPSGAWRACQRLREREAAWARWEDRMRANGYRPRRPENDPANLSEAQIDAIVASLEYDLAGGLDGERLARATADLRRLLFTRGKRKANTDNNHTPDGAR